MTVRSLTWSGLAAVFVLVTLATSPARADVRTEARRHFRSGMALISEGSVDEGVRELLRAYEILPHPNVLYNIGRAYAESGRYEEAVDYFERYLTSDPPDRAEVHGFLEALRERIAALATPSGQAPAGRTPSESAPDPEATSLATEEQLAALTDSATQIDALAESTQSEALHRRADALRRMADRLRSGAPLSVTAGGDPTSRSPGGGGTSSPDAEEAPVLVLGERRQDGTYEETVVSSSRAAQSPIDAPNAITIITAQDIRLSGIQPAQMLRRVPGVDVMQNSPFDVQFSIRGLNQRLNNRAIVLIDGRSVYLDFVGGQFWGLFPINPEDIDRIEVIRGPASALYGADAFTGVVNILTRRLGEGRSHVSAGIGSHGQYRLTSSVTERVGDRVRLRLWGGYEQADAFSRAVRDERVDYEPGFSRFDVDPNLGGRVQRFGGEAEVRVSDDLSIRAGTGLAQSTQTIQGLSLLRELDVDNALFAQSYVQANTSFGLSARVFWNRLSANVATAEQHQGGLELAQRTVVDRQDVLDAEIVYTNTFTIVGGIDNQIIAGVGYRFKEIDWDWLRDPITQSQTYTQHHGNLFLQDTLRIEDVVAIVLSARGDLHPLFDAPQLSPRGSVLLHPTPRQTIRVSVGTAFRSPTLLESYANVPTQTPVRGVTAIARGNTDMDPERIVSIELGYMLQEFEFFQLELTGYYNLVFDQREIAPQSGTDNRLWNTVNDPTLRFDPNNAAFPIGQLRFDNSDAAFQQIGGEVGIRTYPIEGLDIYANYAIHETSPLDDQQDLRGLELDQRTSLHKVNAGVQYRSPFGLDLSVDFHYASSQVWVDAVTDVQTAGIAQRPFALPEYFVLNARVGLRLIDDRVELSVVGTNLIMDGHRQHPFGQRIDRRLMGHVTLRW